MKIEKKKIFIWIIPMIVGILYLLKKWIYSLSTSVYDVVIERNIQELHSIEFYIALFLLFFSSWYLISRWRKKEKFDLYDKIGIICCISFLFMFFEEEYFYRSLAYLIDILVVYLYYISPFTTIGLVWWLSWCWFRKNELKYGGLIPQNIASGEKNNSC